MSTRHNEGIFSLSVTNYAFFLHFVCYIRTSGPGCSLFLNSINFIALKDVVVILYVKGVKLANIELKEKKGDTYQEFSQDVFKFVDWVAFWITLVTCERPIGKLDLTARFSTVILWEERLSCYHNRVTISTMFGQIIFLVPH